MKETNFIEQNKHKWNEFENELKSDSKNPEKLNRLFIETTDDLSFSRTYYPNRSVRVYLNDRAQQIFQRIYKTRTDRKKNFRSFWRLNLPHAMWENRFVLMWAAIIFFVGMAIAVLSSVYNEDFATIMLGPAYIAETMNNIENGDPMAIYGNMEPVEMFIFIAQNNIRVCLLVFILGMFAGVGTIFILFRESIRIGAFLFFFYQKELFEDAFYAVMLHGTIELSMIILSGMAGMVLAKGLVFPKSFSRLQSFILSARQGIMIMIGVSAFLLIAAFIEGFATRHTDVSNLIRGLVIFSSFAVVIAYFVIYPYTLHRSGKLEEIEHDELQPEQITEVEFDEIKNSGTIFTELFFFFKKGFNLHLKTAIWSALAGGIGVLFIVGRDNLSSFLFDQYSSLTSSLRGSIFDIIYPWNEINNLFAFEKFALLYPLLTVVFALTLWTTARSMTKTRFEGLKKLHTGRAIISALITSAVLLFPFFLDSGDDTRDYIILGLFLFLLFPVGMLIFTTSFMSDINWFSAANKTIALLKGSFGRLFSASFFIMAMPWILAISCSSWIWEIIQEIIALNMSSDADSLPVLPYLIYAVFMLFILGISVPLYTYGMALLHGSLTEIGEANKLRSKIQDIKFKKKAFGIEQE